MHIQYHTVNFNILICNQKIIKFSMPALSYSIIVKSNSSKSGYELVNIIFAKVKFNCIGVNKVLVSYVI